MILLTMTSLVPILIFMVIYVVDLSQLSKILISDVKIYWYYLNLTPEAKLLHKKCHKIHNDLYAKAFKILNHKFEYTVSQILKYLTVTNLKMIIVNIVPVSLDLGIDFGYLNGHTDLDLFFPQASFTNCCCFSKTFMKCWN